MDSHAFRRYCTALMSHRYADMFGVDVHDESDAPR